MNLLRITKVLVKSMMKLLFDDIGRVTWLIWILFLLLIRDLVIGIFVSVIALIWISVRIIETCYNIIRGQIK